MIGDGQTSRWPVEGCPRVESVGKHVGDCCLVGGV